jgi:hypothetical protein
MAQMNHNQGLHAGHNRHLGFDMTQQYQNSLLKYIGRPSSEFTANPVTEDQWGVADSLIKKWGGAMEIVKSTIVQAAMEISKINTHVLPLKHAHSLKLQMPIRTISRPMMQQTAERAPYRMIVTSMQYITEELDRHAIGFQIGTEVLADSPLGQQEYADKMNATVEALRFAMEHSGLVQLVGQQTYESLFPITRPVQNPESRFYDYMMAQIGTYCAIAKSGNGFEFLCAAAQKVGKSLSSEYDTVIMTAGSRQLERVINPTTRSITINNCEEMVKLGSVEDQQTIEINMIGGLYYIEHQPRWCDISKSLSECPLTRPSATASSFPLTISETDDGLRVDPIQIVDLCTHSRVTLTTEMLEKHVTKSFSQTIAFMCNTVDPAIFDGSVKSKIVEDGGQDITDAERQTIFARINYEAQDYLASVDYAILSVTQNASKDSLVEIYEMVSNGNAGMKADYLITAKDIELWTTVVGVGALTKARKLAADQKLTALATKVTDPEFPLRNNPQQHIETCSDILQRYNKHYRLMAIRPNQTLLTSAMIYCKGGGAVGNTWFHMSMFKLGNDPGEGVHTVEGLAYYKAWVSNSRAVLVMGDVVPAGIVSGCGHDFMEGNIYNPVDAINQGPQYGDLFLMWVLKDSDTNLPICMSTAGLKQCKTSNTFRVSNHLDDYDLDSSTDDRCTRTAGTLYYTNKKGKSTLFVGGTYRNQTFASTPDDNNRGWMPTPNPGDKVAETYHFKRFGIQNMAIFNDITAPAVDDTMEARVPHFAFPGTCWWFIKEQGVFKLQQRNSGHLGSLDMPNASRGLRGMFEASPIEEA